jgi:hypothetical protein
MLYVFGLSAWWWIVLLLVFVWWGYRRLDGQRAPATAARSSLPSPVSGPDRRQQRTRDLAFLHRQGNPAGWSRWRHGHRARRLGRVRYLGYTGATLTLFALLMLGWSMFSGMSWITCRRTYRRHSSKASSSASQACSNAGRTDASDAKSRVSERRWSRARRSAGECALESDTESTSPASGQLPRTAVKKPAKRTEAHHRTDAESMSRQRLLS